MSIRIKAILIIALTNLIIILFSVFAGNMYVSRSIRTSQEAAMSIVGDIADHYVSSEIELLKVKASKLAQSLEMGDEEQWSQLLERQISEYPEFIGAAVFDKELGRIADAGDIPAPLTALEDTGIRQAFNGRNVLDTTYFYNDEVVFYLAVPLKFSENNILAVTVPGIFFHERLKDFVVWDSGHILLLDSEGTFVSNPRINWVEERSNTFEMSAADDRFVTMMVMVNKMVRGESGIEYYYIYDVERVAAFGPVRGSEDGWSFATVAPIPESPFLDINAALQMVGVVAFFLSIIVALVFSIFIKRPFVKIAELKEEAELNSHYKTQFLANMSHEVRTPMNVILGVTEILIHDNTFDTATNEKLLTIYNSGDMLLSIINDILDFSKIEAGKLELMPDIYDTASMIHDTAALNMMRSGSKSIKFKLSVDENLPTTLIGDELRIKQVLNNLLSNAFKYTDEGEVELSFLIEDTNREDELTLVFSVRDTGRGMTEEQVSKMFDEYSRFSFDASISIESSGLGMGISQNLVNLMNGKITVESKLHEGSLFTVHIPQTRSGTDKLGSELVERLQDFELIGLRQIRKSSMIYEYMPYGRIMIVDDVESNLFVAKGLMAPYGLLIDTVVSGYQAIERIDDGNVYDIIFMDHMMPKMNGVEATKIIRDKGYAEPIIALTANAVVGQSEIFLANGFNDFISKPIDVRHLNTILRKYIRDKQPLDVLEAADAAMKELEINTANEMGHQSVSAQLAEFFVRDVMNAVEALEAVDKKLGKYDEEDVSLFTTTVHAMKTALANVGEIELSALAERLEQAGWRNETNLISAETSEFIDKLRKTVLKFTPLDESGKSTAAEDGDYDYLHQKLTIIKEACDVYDKKKAKDAVTALRQKRWPPEINELLGTVAEKLLSGDLESVDNTIDVIIKKSDDPNSFTK